MPSKVALGIDMKPQAVSLLAGSTDCIKLHPLPGFSFLPFLFFFFLFKLASLFQTFHLRALYQMDMWNNGFRKRTVSRARLGGERAKARRKKISE